MFNIALPQFPCTQIYIGLVTNVSNADEIKTKIASLPYGFIDARNIISQEQLLSAVYRALTEKEYNKLRTKNLHSEIVFSLSPNSNIEESFKRFGIQSDSKTVLVLKAVSDEEFFDVKDMLSQVEGLEIELNDKNLRAHADISLIKKNYRLNELNHGSIEELSTALVHAIQLCGL